MDYRAAVLSSITEERERFGEVFRSSLRHENPLLNQVLEHVLRASGKKMRPMLVLLAAKLFGKVNEATIHAAIALELLHNASLVHDDVVDESGERRGEPSVNAAFGNKVAVLSGDYLLATGLLEVEKTGNLAIMDIFFRLGRDLADGELLQLHHAALEDYSYETYFEVIRKKTAILFEACASAGALSVGASEQEVEMMRRFGELVGLCFQIKDDIFDYVSDSRQVGKPTGNDMAGGKLTLPLLYALNQMHDAEAGRIASRVKSGDATREEILWLIDFTVGQGGIAYAEQVMNRYRVEAAALLETVPSCEVKTSLLAYMDLVIHRER